MLKIGEFAILSGISIVMLRNYDKIGLLVPSHIDNINGYRYYDKDQLVIANQIVSMKSMGFGLEEIKKSFDLPGEELRGLFQKKINEKEYEQREIARQLEALRRTKHLEEIDDKQIALRIVTKTMKETYALCLRKELKEYNQEGILWGEMMNLIKSKKLPVPENAIAASWWHSRDEEKGYIDVDILLYIDNPLRDIEPLYCRKIEEHEVASIMFKGSYLQIYKINTMLAKWIEVNRYEMVSDPYSIYHKSPKNSDNEEKFFTEICFPIRRTKYIKF